MSFDLVVFNSIFAFNLDLIPLELFLHWNVTYCLCNKEEHYIYLSVLILCVL